MVIQPVIFVHGIFLFRFFHSEPSKNPVTTLDSQIWGSPKFNTSGYKDTIHVLGNNFTSLHTLISQLHLPNFIFLFLKRLILPQKWTGRCFTLYTDYILQIQQLLRHHAVLTSVKLVQVHIHIWLKSTKKI